MLKEDWDELHKHSIFINARIIIETVGGINHEVIGIETHGKIHTVKNNEGFIEIGNDCDELLGILYKYKPWHKWVWEQDIGVIMSSDCLDDVSRYMKAVNDLEDMKKHNVKG